MFTHFLLKKPGRIKGSGFLITVPVLPPASWGILDRSLPLPELWFPHLQNGDRGQKPPPGERVRWHKHAQSLAWRPVREHHVENVKPQTPHSGGGGRSFAAGGALGPAVFTDSFVSI